MRIAIIDDRTSDRGLLAEKIEEYMTSHGLDYEVAEFDSGETFLDAFEEGGFALVFLDIYMDGINGMETARKVFELDRACKIIFLTVTGDYSVQGYSVRAVYYLIKPIDNSEFLRAMELCELTQETQTAMLKVVSNGVELSLSVTRILYVDYIERVTRIHTLDGVLKVNGTFSEVTAPLCKDERFIVCIRGLMVNMQYIDRQENDMFVLKNGERLPINIRRKKAFGKIFRRFIYKEMEEM